MSVGYFRISDLPLTNILPCSDSPVFDDIGSNLGHGWQTFKHFLHQQEALGKKDLMQRLRIPSRRVQVLRGGSPHHCRAYSQILILMAWPF